MSQTLFGNAMFDLADLWCENIDDDDYTAFLRDLRSTVINDMYRLHGTAIAVFASVVAFRCAFSLLH